MVIIQSLSVSVCERQKESKGETELTVCRAPSPVVTVAMHAKRSVLARHMQFVMITGADLPLKNSFY